MKKPAIEWFESVKDDELREKLINNADINGWSSYPKSSLARAISSGFAWHKAPEGIEYWRSIRDKAILGEIELKDVDSEDTLPGSKEEIINPKVSRGDILEKLNRVEELLIEIKKEI